MAEREDPKVVFLGKGRKNSAKFQEMLSSLETFSVPAEFIEGIYVTDLTEKRYKINQTLLTESIGYDNISKEMHRLGIVRDVKMIEVVIDFDKAQNSIQQQSADILDSLFNT